jgi:hypothetical protein
MEMDRAEIAPVAAVAVVAQFCKTFLLNHSYGDFWKTASKAPLAPLHPTRTASRFWRVGNDLGKITASQIALHKQR